MVKRKVLIVSCTPFYGGAEIFVRQVFSVLESQFDLFYQVRNQDLYEKLTTERKYLVGGELSFWDEIKFARGLIRENKIDVVVLNGNRAIYMAPFLPQTVAKIAYKHTSMSSTPWYKRGVCALLITLGFGFSDKIVGVSRMVIDEIKGFERKKVVVYNGVKIPEEERKHSDGKIRLVYVGRLEKEKGIMEAVAAVEQLSRDYSVVLDVAGTGTLKAELQAKIQKNEWKNIRLLGHVDNVYEVLLGKDVFILPTYHEAISLSILEAMACALPVVATNVGGISEAVKNGETGILVASKDVSSLKEGIEKLLRNKKMREEMGQKGRERAITCFNVEKTINEVAELLRTTKR